MKSSLGWVFGVLFVASLVIVALALRRWGAAEIRANAGEVVLLTGLGGVWIFLASRLFSWLGLSYCDDVVERRNAAALVAWCGGMLAVTLIYVGGSLGEGPSYSNNFFSAGLGTAGMVSLWILLELGANVSRSITEERDFPSGLRMGGFLLAIGLVLGRAVAGDWHSEAATVRDFIHDGWPTALLCALALAVELFARPTRDRPFPPWLICGLLPASIYLALAGACLWHVGPWEGLGK